MKLERKLKGRLKCPLNLFHLSYCLILVALLTVASGCTDVAAWQKGNLAKKHMQFDPDPLESRFVKHVEDSREAGAGGYGVGGGGCGCR